MFKMEDASAPMVLAEARLTKPVSVLVPAKFSRAPALLIPVLLRVNGSAMAVRLRTVKSGSAPGLIRCRSASSALISSSTRGMAASDSAFTLMNRTVPWNCAPNSLRCAVVTGTSTVSSWSRPSRLCPRLFMTPTTTNEAFLMRIVLPTGSSAPNRLSTTVCPSIATRVAPRTSESSNIEPPATPQDDTSR